MSSFVISKNELMKAAGFISAFAETPNYFREPLIRMWSYKYNRVMTGEDFIECFNLVFKMNAESVQLQYGDKTAETDTNEYKAEYKEAVTKTKKMILNAQYGITCDLEKMIYSFTSFASSILYQIEDDNRHQKVKNFLNDIQSHLLNALCTLKGYSEDCTSWSTFEVLTDKERIA